MLYTLLKVFVASRVYRRWLLRTNTDLKRALALSTQARSSALLALQTLVFISHVAVFTQNEEPQPSPSYPPSALGCRPYVVHQSQ